jgi:glycosyltransferase involved in cell wall biosynthesis
LNSLQQQTFLEYEIVVANNALDSRTDEMVRDFGIASNVPVRCISSPPGVLHEARHAGAQVAEGGILVFTDDDATFDPGWLEGYCDAFAEHPEMAAAGGPVRPVWEVPPPLWLVDLMSDTETWGAKLFGPLSLIMDKHEEFCLGPKGFFWGVNMAIRRDVLFEVGGFNPEAFGETWLGDGESGLKRKLDARAMPVGYVPEAIVFHHIPSQRMTPEYICRRMANEGACRMYQRYHTGIPGKWRLLADAYQIIRDNGYEWIDARKRKRKTDRRSIYMQMRAAETRAQVSYIIRLLVDAKFRHMVTKTDWL